MITKLTRNQEKLLGQVRQEWLDLFFKPKPFSEIKAKEAVEWLYFFCGLEKPKVLFFDSPLGCQFAANVLKYGLKQVDSQLYSQVDSQVYSQVCSQVYSQIDSQVRSQVRSQVCSQVDSQVYSQVDSEVGSQKLKEYFSFANYGNYSDLGWSAWADFCNRIYILKVKELDNWLAYQKVGIYDCIQLKSFCLVCKMPKSIKRNANNDLHCEKGAAVEWNDGYKNYFVHGIGLDLEVGEKFFGNKLSVKDILGFENQEQRRV